MAYNEGMLRKLPAACAILAVILSGCSTAQNNASTATAQTDFTGPYINMSQYEFTTVRGKAIDFSNITGYDDVDGLLKVRLEGYVDYNTPGDYYPSLTCTDFSGNKSSVTITIHVVDKMPVPSASAVVQPQIQPAPDASACADAEDPDQPCKAVLDDSLKDYQTIYEGEAGKEACLAEGDEDSCEEIRTNDGTFWGYGLKK